MVGVKKWADHEGTTRALQPSSQKLMDSEVNEGCIHKQSE